MLLYHSERNRRISNKKYKLGKTKMNNTYDVIVVGSGHAGCESALATSRMGLKTLAHTKFG